YYRSLFVYYVCGYTRSELKLTRRRLNLREKGEVRHEISAPVMPQYDPSASRYALSRRSIVNGIVFPPSGGMKIATEDANSQWRKKTSSIGAGDCILGWV
ncbi:MAG: hypothetical protein WCQ50_20145, partial [Spirochaetota bacterium]